MTKINGEVNLKSSANRDSVYRDDYTDLGDQEKLNAIEFHFEEIMKVLGLDLKNASLSETPKRVAKMYVTEVFKGLDITQFPNVSFFENTNQYHEMIMVNNIKMYSYCEHHFVPVFGKASVAYIPKDRVIGLSKINRIVQFFASKPQIQEKLTVEIGEKLKDLLKTDDIAIHIEATHLCVASRGIEDESSQTKTYYFNGKFLKDEEKARFLNSLNR